MPHTRAALIPLISFCFVVLVIVPLRVRADPVEGRACYRFSDNESIIAARDIALSLAKRDALEKYSVFVESTSTVENTTLKNDLITSIGAAFLNNIRVTSQTESLDKREVCSAISAMVEPVAIKEQVVAKINASRRQGQNTPTGLPENLQIKVLKATRIGGGLQFSVLCKFKKLPRQGGHPGLRITFIDRSGVQEETVTRSPICSRIGDIEVIMLPLPKDTGSTFAVEAVSD